MRRLRLHRPSAATIISLIALFFAMSGTAVAATGGNFILGKANTASSVSSLTNTAGTALSLTSTSTTPPLKVSNSVQVPNLNASKLDGQTSSAFLAATGTAANSSELGGQPPSAFLPANGTAANSAELGGQPASAYLGVNGTAANSTALGGTPASGYMQGGGDTTGARATPPPGGDTTFLLAPGAALIVTCDFGGAGSGPSFFIAPISGVNSGATALWWNKDGVGSNTSFQSSGGSYVTPGNGSTTPYAVVVQVDNVTSVSTFTATEWYASGSDTCHGTGQVVTTNG